METHTNLSSTYLYACGSIEMRLTIKINAKYHILLYYVCGI